MKITIIQFSPSGYTSKVTTMIENELKKRKQEVQIIDITCDEIFFITRNIHEFLEKNVEQHDVLLIGAPVYAHHLQYHVQDLLKALPRPNNIWGKYAIPYVCYGGISSGVALKEAANLLSNSGRMVHAGMKVSAPHSMTREFMNKEFNSDKRQLDQLPEVIDLVDRTMQLEIAVNVKCNAKSMSYNGFIIALKAKFIFKEKVWHEKRYPQVTIDKSLCTDCGKCVIRCPVKHFVIEGKVVKENTQSSCIHCLNCVTGCPSKAIKLIGDLEKGRAFMTKMIAENGNKEKPETAVYPILKTKKTN